MRYRAICLLIGLPLAWVPRYFHGPIPYKFNALGIHGDVAVWGWYTARMLIGFVVGVTTWPPVWWLRGPLFGFLAMLPLGLVVLATPGCGGT